MWPTQVFISLSCARLRCRRAAGIIKIEPLLDAKLNSIGGRSRFSFPNNTPVARRFLGAKTRRRPRRQAGYLGCQKDSSGFIYRVRVSHAFLDECASDTETENFPLALSPSAPFDQGRGRKYIPAYDSFCIRGVNLFFNREYINQIWNAAV
jgi:hypothetical protein